MKFGNPVIDSVNYNKELFDFLKTIFPNAKAVPKREYYYNNKPSHKIKASVIICPEASCNYHLIEDHDPLIDHFLRHMKKAHHINPPEGFVDNLKATINFLRNNNRIPYIDPFIHVRFEDLLSE